MPLANHNFDDPLRILRESHRHIEHFLSALIRLAEAKRGAALAEHEKQEFGTALRYFRFAAPKHTADEEESLFPRLRRVPHSTLSRVPQCIDTLDEEHGCADRSHGEVDRLGRLWLQADTLRPEQASRLLALLTGLAALYQKHIQIEEAELFPVAATVLSPSDLEAIGGEMAARRERRHAAYGSVAGAP